MPKRNDLNKILVIGSGPIVIGQAAEFDYSGSQACLSLREEGYQVILINSNPATIMTDKDIADKVFIEPITYQFVAKILRSERPDAILPTLGGQTGLNMAKELADSKILDELNIELLGSDLNSIQKAEDRQQFKDLMNKLNEPVPESKTVTSINEAKNFVKQIGYPVVIRPAFTLGGTGGGFANNDSELAKIADNGLNLSAINQVLIERSIKGYKEIEFEVMRDSINNSMIVAALENIDPVGIHTGDSIVTAPTQTLSDKEYQLLRDVALKVINALSIQGGCNIQMALDPNSMKYYIIEVNPRVSRSSALASKATGYPIAKISSKIAIGMNLDEIKNPITNKTWAEFEPALDYIVTKIPKFPFNKFPTANRNLGTQMKATGEVMAIGRNFEESILKAIRSLDISSDYLNGKRYQSITTKDLLNQLSPAKDDRIFVILELFRRNISVDTIYHQTQINSFYLFKLNHIVEIEDEIKDNNDTSVLRMAKQNGFTDQRIAELVHSRMDKIRNFRKVNQIQPVYKMVDTSANEFEANTPYYYSTYEKENESKVTGKSSVLVLGSGPIRIGQGIEFDYSTVHCVKSIQNAGYQSIIMNSNPETVSTDFSMADKLYFEPLTIEDVLNVIDLEKPIGVIVQFGGQTAINLVRELYQHGINILGTKVNNINASEDRQSFESIVNELDINHPKGITVTTSNEAIQIAHHLEYPILIRPSYVIGGEGMEIIHSDDELNKYIDKAVQVSEQYPVLIDSYLNGLEAEVDLVSDGNDVVIPGILEHIEHAGVHSGDSMAVYPPQRMSDKIKRQIVNISIKLAQRLHIKGLMNVQFVIHQNKVYVLEVNPRSSRTVPFISKVTKVPLASLATEVMLGKQLNKMGYQSGLMKEKKRISVKAPIFSFDKLPQANSILGPEMKSTGEVMGSDDTYPKALEKAFNASGIKILDHGNILMILDQHDLNSSLTLVQSLLNLGFDVYTNNKGYKFYHSYNLNVCLANKVIDSVKKSKYQLVIDSINKGINDKNTKIRNITIQREIPLFTALDTLGAFTDIVNTKVLNVLPL